MIMPVPSLINMPVALNGSLFLFVLAMPEAGVVRCGGRKTSPHTSSIVQIIFSFWFFEVSEGILMNRNITSMIG